MFRRRALHLMVAVSATLGLDACSETFDSTYATFSEAESKGAIVRGWVPGWLPPSATKIREVHNIDTNRFMLGFSVATAQRWLFLVTASRLALVRSQSRR